MVCCNKCDKVVGETFVTAFGEVLCEDCWDNYICTREGKLEYLLGICKGDYPASEFDQEFLREAAESWNENREILRNQSSFTEKEIAWVDATAIAICSV